MYKKSFRVELETNSVKNTDRQKQNFFRIDYFSCSIPEKDPAEISNEFLLTGRQKITQSQLNHQSLSTLSFPQSNHTQNLNIKIEKG